MEEKIRYHQTSSKQKAPYSFSNHEAYIRGLNSERTLKADRYLASEAGAKSFWPK